MIVTLRPETDGTYTVMADDEPVEGMENKPQVLAEFLAEWIREADKGCRQLLQRKIEESN